MSPDLSTVAALPVPLVRQMGMTGGMGNMGGVPMTFTQPQQALRALRGKPNMKVNSDVFFVHGFADAAFALLLKWSKQCKLRIRWELCG